VRLLWKTTCTAHPKVVHVYLSMERGNYMKRYFSLFLCMILISLSAPIVAQATSAYTQATATTEQKSYPKNLGNGQYDMMLNGGMELVQENGSPSDWGFSHPVPATGAYCMTATGNDAKEGKNYAVISGKAGGRIYFSQNFTNLLPNEYYTFRGYMRKISGASNPTLNITFQAKSGSTYAHLQTLYHTPALGSDWTLVEYTFCTHAETARVLFVIRLDGEAEFHVDDTHMIGLPNREVLTLVSFKETIDQEAATRAKIEKTYAGAGDGSTVPGQPENIVSNGALESSNGTSFSGWGPSHSGYLSVASDASHDGSDCAHITVPANVGLKHPYYAQISNIVGGATYEISYWYKVVSGGADVCIKLECYSDRSLPGAVSLGGWHIGTSINDGQWHQYKGYFIPPDSATEASVLARMLQRTESEISEAYIDDVVIRMVQPPEPLNFSTDGIFYYTDETVGTMSTSINLQYYSQLANTKIDFEILDGESVLWQNKGVISQNGQASSGEFPLSLLEKKEHTYLAKATLYNTDNTVMEVKVQQIFRYDRPQYLGADGVYMQNGTTPFYPIYAYHVGADAYQKVAEAGVNLVQIGSADTAEYAVSALDAAEEAGIMGFICLYYDMKPAGHVDNIERTIRILSDSRIQNHPALYGYGVMDEVFLGLADPQQDMENSYRLIRMLDKKRPIITMEAVSNYYDECGKYVDVLCIDPYSSAAGKNASTSTEIARAAVRYKKPVYSLLETYYNTHGRFPLPEDGRNNNYQALIAGANAVGYFSISDSDVGANGEAVAIWDARDGGKLWNALVTFGQKEKDLAYDHYVFDKSPEFNEERLSDYWYSSWVVNNKLYMVVLGMKEGQSKTVSIPLESFSGDIRLGAYTARVIAGRENASDFSGNGTLNLTISGVEAVLFEITPQAGTVDFSSLYTTSFEDLEGHNWARQQIHRIGAQNIMVGKSDWEFAPGEAISKAELAEVFGRALNTTVSGNNSSDTVTLTEALALCRTALHAVFTDEKAAALATLDVAATLRGALERWGVSMGSTVTRAHAAALADRLLYWKDNADAVNAISGFTIEEADALVATLLNSQSTGTKSGAGWYMPVGDAVFVQNISGSAAAIPLANGGSYGQILGGNTTLTVSQSASSASLPAYGFALVRISQDLVGGFYIGNVSEKHLRPGITYTVRGGVAAEYTQYGSVKELLECYMDGQQLTVEDDANIKLFTWDELMRPVQ